MTDYSMPCHRKIGQRRLYVGLSPMIAAILGLAAIIFVLALMWWWTLLIIIPAGMIARTIIRKDNYYFEVLFQALNAPDQLY